MLLVIPEWQKPIEKHRPRPLRFGALRMASRATIHHPSSLAGEMSTELPEDQDLTLKTFNTPNLKTLLVLPW